MKSQQGYALVHSFPRNRIGPVALLRGAWLQVRRWQQLARERRQLATLDTAALKDLGLTRGDVFRESERPFWDDPLATTSASHKAEYRLCK
ncbi:DUF1127 domain-containing protein [Pseudomonas zhanjiangensis]|uniref:DUF1127 domain-containing protein n=1 Tax=Pseudomonas zhanjiangensis TaxID=3239015 RepID=A0ABV3YZG7_9PSED